MNMKWFSISFAMMMASGAAAQPEKVLVKSDGTFELVMYDPPLSPADSASLEFVPVYSVQDDGSLTSGVFYKGTSETGYHARSFPGRIFIDQDGSYSVQRAHWSVTHGPIKILWERKIDRSSSIPIVNKGDFFNKNINRAGGLQLLTFASLSDSPESFDAALRSKVIGIFERQFETLLKDVSGIYSTSIIWDTSVGLAASPVVVYEFDWSQIKSFIVGNYSGSSTDSDVWEGGIVNQYPNSPLNYVKDPEPGAPFIEQTEKVCLTDMEILAILGQNPIGNAVVLMNPDISWDFDPDDAVLPDEYDFIGTLVHEFGHWLGFLSRVEAVTYYQEDPIHLWDVYRLSEDDFVARALEFNAHDRELSFGGNAIAILGLGDSLNQPNLSTGAVPGIGTHQASHWLHHFSTDPDYIGIMSPVATKGESDAVGGSYLQPADIRAFDLMGFDIDETAISVPFIASVDIISPTGDISVDVSEEVVIHWDTDSEILSRNLTIYDLGYPSEGNSPSLLGEPLATVYRVQDLTGSTYTIDPNNISLIPGHRYQIHTAAWNAFGPKFSSPATFIASGAEPGYIPQWGEFTESAELVPSADLVELEFIGGDVAISGDWAAMGGSLTGGWPWNVYIFRKDGSRWIHEQTIHAPNPDLNEFIGSTVRISGDLMVINDQPYGSTIPSGEPGIVYVYRFNGNKWALEDTLTGSDTVSGDHFGQGLAVEGDTIIVGSGDANTINGVKSGAAYVFERLNGTWIEVAKLLEDPANGDPTGNRFGATIGLSGDHMIIGSFRDDFQGLLVGSATVFSHDGIQWVRQQALYNSDPIVNDNFAQDIAIDGDFALIGAFGGTATQGDPVTSAGRVFVYEYDGLSWVEVDVLSSGTGVIGEGFGVSVDIDGNLAVIGAGGASSAKDIGPGICYVYRKNPTANTWVQQATLQTADGELGEISGLGWSIAIDNGTVIAGAPLTNGSSNGPFIQGSAFVFELNPCPADLTGEGNLDFFDISTFLQLFGAQDPVADWNIDGSFDFFDYSGYLADFSTGCP